MGRDLPLNCCQAEKWNVGIPVLKCWFLYVHSTKNEDKGMSLPIYVFFALYLIAHSFLLAQSELPWVEIISVFSYMSQH